MKVSISGMKLNKLFIILLLSKLCLGRDFQNMTLGTRNIALSNSGSVLVRDIQSLFNNPAGLAFITEPQIFTQLSFLHLGLTDDSRLFGGALAFAHTYKKLGTLTYGLVYFTLQNHYQEYMPSISLSRLLVKPVYAGITLKPLIQTYNLTDYYIRQSRVFKKTNTLINVSMDQGFIIEFSPNVHLGIAFIDLLQPNIGLHVTEQLPMKMRVGAGLKFRELNAGLDFIYQRNHFSLNIGCERDFVFKDHAVGLCGGFSIGSRNYLNFAFGASYIFKSLKIEYAFVVPKFPLNFGTHNLSISYKFGFKEILMPEVPHERLIAFEEERKELLLQIENLTKQIKTLTKEREDLRSKIKTLEERLKVAEAVPKAAEAATKEIISLRAKITELEEKLFAAEKQIIEREERLKELERRVSVAAPSPPSPPSPRPPAVAPVPKPPSPPQIRTHKVLPGETLVTIAQKYYGDPDKWKVIYEANKDKITRGQAMPGQVLVIP